MGFHYVNGPALQNPALDPMKPEILLYARAAPGGGLTLVGVEYWKADADQNVNTDDDRRRPPDPLRAGVRRADARARPGDAHPLRPPRLAP